MLKPNNFSLEAADLGDPEQLPRVGHLLAGLGVVRVAGGPGHPHVPPGGHQPEGRLPRQHRGVPHDHAAVLPQAGGNGFR